MTKTGVDLTTYRSTIGLWAGTFISRHRIVRGRRRKACPTRLNQSLLFIILYFFLLLRATALPVDGDVERNPGPSPSSSPSNSNLNMNVNRLHRHGRGCATAAAPRSFAWSTRQLSVLHFNARSLLAKKSELADVVSSSKPDVIAVTETWLSPTVPDGALLLPDFDSIVRADRTSSHASNASIASSTKRRGGGVLLLLRNSIQYSIRDDLRTWSESIWVEIQLRSSSPLIVGCFYRPPDSQVSAFSDSLDLSFSRLDISRTKVLLVGDFNAKSPSWLSSDCYNAAGLILEPLFLQLGLQQCVSSPTHLSPDGTLGSLLDLALASPPSLVSRVDAHPPLGSSDHLLVLCQLDARVD